MTPSKGAQTAIPTEYMGINFRSRLEATWAAFFDLCGWDWEYEPFDLPGYIPDFLIKGKTPFVVDVRPCVTSKEYYDRAHEVAKACEGMNILVVGTGIIDHAWDASIGVMSEAIWKDEGDEPWLSGAMLMTCNKCGQRSFRHEDGCFQSIICGHYDGDGYMGPFDDAAALWASAKNATQWRAVTPRNRHR